METQKLDFLKIGYNDLNNSSQILAIKTRVKCIIGRHLPENSVSEIIGTQKMSYRAKDLISQITALE